MPSEPLTAVSSIDGRYRDTSSALAEHMSEYALIRARVRVESEYLIALSETKGVGLRALTTEEKKLLAKLADISVEDAKIVKAIEKEGYEGIPATNHDVKAVEYFLKLKLAKTSLVDVSEWLHFALTSEDVNSVSLALMLRGALQEVIEPALKEIDEHLGRLAKEYAKTPMLARTHGQGASPTTFGKEFKVFSERLKKQLAQLNNQKISVKLSGATGNFNAHVAAFPKIDWVEFATSFIEKFNSDREIKLELNLTVTQIDPHDSEAGVFDNLRRINTILIDFNQDIWRYISDEWIVQKPADGTVGSSTMPHKINPIKFENSEGNLGMANTFFEFFSRKLPISRLQRDLSDSTVERNFGPALAYSLIAYEYLLKGLSQISINEEKVKQDLNNHPEVITEAIQTILRREGVAMPYEKLKELSRGKKITLTDINKFIDTLEVSKKIKEELKKITPENYIGLASKLASNSVR